MNLHRALMLFLIHMSISAAICAALGLVFGNDPATMGLCGFLAGFFIYLPYYDAGRPPR